MMAEQLNIKRDKQYPYFCQACLGGKPETETSFDTRYCKGCCDFLLKEAEMDTNRRNSDWKPINSHNTPDKREEKAAQSLDTCAELCPPQKAPQNTVDIIQPLDPQKKATNRGRPRQLDLPEELIKELASEGMGSKAIASQLRRGGGIKASYKTIQRVLTGQR